MTKYYILVSVSNVIQHQLQNVNHAVFMMIILKEMFGEQIRAAKLDTVRTLLNTKMAEGIPMREHCLVMIAMLRGVNEPSLSEPRLSRHGSFIFGSGSSSSRAWLCYSSLTNAPRSEPNHRTRSQTSRSDLTNPNQIKPPDGHNPNHHRFRTTPTVWKRERLNDERAIV